MTFAHSHILWLLLVIPPLLLVFFWWSLRERRRLMAQFIEARLLENLVAGVSSARLKAPTRILPALVLVSSRCNRCGL